MAELVVACLHGDDQRPSVDPLTGRVSRDERAAGFSAADEAALEHALRLGEQWELPILAVVSGPAALLREVAAHGVRTVGIACAAPYLTDLAIGAHAAARATAEVIRAEGEPAVVLCGDWGTGAFPALLAHELGAAQALGLISLTGGADLVGERRLDGGRREVLRIPRPAVCSIEAAGVRLRRAPLPAFLSAGETSESRKYDVIASPPAAHPLRPRTRTVAPPPGTDPRDRLVSLTAALTERSTATVVGPVDAVAGADELLGFLDKHGYRP